MSIAYSFPKDNRDDNGGRYNSPSPDNYNPDRSIRVIKDTSPEWSFPRTGRQEIVDGGPGPGQYDSNMNKMKMNVSYTMGSKTQNQTPRKADRYGVPGPGSYEPSSQTKPPTFSQFIYLNYFSMGGKRQNQKLLNVPGPGFYEISNPNNSNKNSQSYGASPFGTKSKRDTSMMNTKSNRERLLSPGPGAYSPKHESIKHKNPTFGMSKGQKGISSKDINPGPGAYDGVKKEIGKSLSNISMGQRPQTAKPSNTPGPGAYSNHNRTITDVSKSQRGVSSMKNKSDRLNHLTKDQINAPGPGAYGDNQSQIKDNARNTVFAKTQRDNQIGKDERMKPGPGNYDVPNTQKIKSFKIGQKINQHQLNQNPGPGNYDPNSNAVKDSLRNVKISSNNNKSALSHSKSTNLMPGPGQYDQSNKIGSNVASFSMRGRPKDNNRNNSPGPGQYQPSDVISKDRVPAANIMSGSKRNNEFHKTQNAVGPGQYNDQSKDFGKDSKSFTIKQRPQDKLDNNIPGPGQYNANDDYVKHQSAAFIQAKSQRQDILSKDVYNKPGPGQYDNSHKTIGKDVQSYTMGKKTQYLRQEMSPGPGAYDANSNNVKDSIKNGKMSTSQRPDITQKQARDMPGPGNYDSDQQFGKNTPQFTMQSKRDAPKRDQIPGPGAYYGSDAVNRDKSPSFRMGTGQRTQMIGKDVMSSPGPGNYEQISKIGGNGPQYSFQPRNEPKIQVNNPGPGGYDPNINVVRDNQRSFQMGTSQRQQMISKEAQYQPGPGIYDSPSKIGQNGPQYTMGKRSKSRQDLGPGPGQYEPVQNLTRDKTPSFAISRTLRNEIVQKQVSELPGPGQYQNVDEFGKDNKSFSIRGRPDDKNQSNVPGPGQYSTEFNQVKNRVVSHKISKSMRADIVTKEMLNQPGPGEYDSPQRFGDNAQSITIRGRPQDNSRNDSPGPGNYDPQVEHVKDRSKAYKMSNSKRTDLITKEQRDLPGPGVYDQHSTIAKGVAYTISQRPKDQQDNRVPGPGQYEPRDHLVKDQALNSFKMSQSQRGDIISKSAKEMPGPGNYQNQKNFGEDAQTFSIRSRPQDKVGNEIPGPGNYDPNIGQSKDRVIAYKIGSDSRGEIISKERVNSPGPGQYESPQKQGGPNFSIGLKNQEPINNNVPGPGQYAPNESMTKYQSPAYNMNNGTQRTNLVTQDQMSLPGPGVYDQPSTLGQGPNFSIRGKPNTERDNGVPGPGYYDATLDVVKDNARSYKMGTNKRDYLTLSNEQSQLPGPGQYDQHNTISGPAFSIKGRDSTRHDNGIPGPGQYNQQNSQIKHNNPSIDFSRSPDRSKQNSPHKDNQPGPGEYDQRDYNVGGHSVITYSIPKGEIRDPVNDTPGPGHYKLPVKFADTNSYSGIKQNDDYKYV